VLRVLELGAGTGATTLAAVPMLEGYDVDYLFTDMTPFFLPDARERFREQRWLRTGVVDIDRDYREQGLAPNSFDVVVCASMLNSTRDVADAATRVIELLAPGGWLIFTEPTGDQPHILLTQGFMMDPVGGDREQGGTKFLSVERWHELIEKNGGEETLCLPDARHPLAAFGIHAFMARFKTDRQRLSTDQLQAFLAQRLPPHMLPAHLQIVDRLPLTRNGKIDRKLLSGWRPASLADDTPVHADPTLDELERRLCDLWALALGVGRLGKHENFYDRGADSLILARVTGRLREEVPEAKGFTYDTLLRQMLNEPNVEALARALRAPAASLSGPGGEPAARSATVGLQEGEGAGPPRRREGSNSLLVPFGGGQGPVRVMFHAALGTLDYFQHLGSALAAQNLGPVLGVAVADTEVYLNVAPRDLIESVADDYAQRLIDEGYERYQLIGYCLGGLLAIEVARRLMERGCTVVNLALVDSIPMFIETDEELAFEAIFVPNLNLDPVQAVFGDDVNGADVYRGIELLMERHDRKVPRGAMAELGGDPGLDRVAAAVRRQAARPQAERLEAYARAAASQAGVPIGPELVPALFRVCRHSMRAARFDPPPYVGDMTYLRCSEQQSFGITAGVGHLAAPFWENTCLGKFEIIDVPGNHFSVVEPPHVQLVVEHLGAPLRGGR
jgi:pyochelin synthetase